MQTHIIIAIAGGVIDGDDNAKRAENYHGNPCDPASVADARKVRLGGESPSFGPTQVNCRDLWRFEGYPAQKRLHVLTMIP